MAPSNSTPTAHGLLTPQPTPHRNNNRKASPKLHDIPELATRYVPQRDYEEGVEYRNPSKFCVKPFFWNQWSPHDYMRFAEHLRVQFDPVPFAHETGKSVEEIKHLFSALVVNPLYSISLVHKRGEQGMRQIQKLFEEHGTSIRQWGMETHNEAEGGNEEILGELEGIEKNQVRLILNNGTKKVMHVDELNGFDRAYLEQTLSEKQQGILWQRAEGEEKDDGDVEWMLVD